MVWKKHIAAIKIKWFYICPRLVIAELIQYIRLFDCSVNQTVHKAVSKKIFPHTDVVYLCTLLQIHDSYDRPSLYIGSYELIVPKVSHNPNQTHDYIQL